MLDVLVTSINAVVPIILLILLGYLLKRFKFLNNNFIKIGNKFVFKVCLPCMLFINIYDKMDSFADIRWDVVLYSVIVICVIFGLGLLTAVLTTKQANRRGVILQCSFRSNFAIIGLTLVERLGGDTGLAGIISAFSIPVFNILAVIALSVFVKEEAPQPVEGELQSVPQTNVAAAACESSPGVKAAKSKHSVKSIVLNIVKNPLIIGVVIGLVFVAVREIERAADFTKMVEVDGALKEVVKFRFSDQLKFLYTAVKDLKAIASPLALIVLGGQFEFSAVKGMTKEIIVGTAWRILIAPLIGIGVAILLSEYTSIFTFGKDVYPTLIAVFGTPVAVSSAIMAGAMKNDEQLATQLVVWTSICSIVTIFVTVFILMSCGLLAV
ncbi:MAG: AEC family transporter [Clostridia bacterium]|nr:AEC family transporter [Clostridia bacterium]